jgi:hypothetical protein
MLVRIIPNDKCTKLLYAAQVAHTTARGHKDTAA